VTTDPGSPLSAAPLPLEAGAAPLRQRALRGSLWTVASYGVQHALRLGGNIVLARLLFPEAFGLMTLASVFVQGLNMFSDLGLAPSIIQHRRGADPVFLNTAWTLQVIRGFALWICACLLAPLVGSLYGEPVLTQLLPVLGLTALIAGFDSTHLASANRNLLLGRLSLLELASYAFGLLVMIAWAWRSPSVWALAAGALASSLVKMALSHLVLPGARNRFAWDPEAFRAIRRFGQWILASTALTFFAGHGDRVVLGALLDMGALGILGIAAALAGIANEVLIQVGQKVLFPSYSELVRERPERVYAALRRARLVMLAVGWLASLALITLGERLVEVLYDDRYADAGWMLQLLATGMLVGAINTSYRGVIVAFGQTFAQASMLAIQVALKFLLVFAGHHLAGTTGVIAAIAFAGWVSYPVHAFFLSRLSVLQPEVDLPVVGAAVLVTAFLYL